MAKGDRSGVSPISNISILGRVSVRDVVEVSSGGPIVVVPCAENKEPVY